VSPDKPAIDAQPSAKAAPGAATPATDFFASALPRYAGPVQEAPAPRVAEGTTSGYSIAAMILGIVPVLFGILGIVFGFIALSQIKQRGQKGRGNALTGVIGGFLWLAVGIAALTAAALGGGSAGTADIDTLAAGQCFTAAAGAATYAQVTAVDCAQPHTGQLFAKYEAAYTTYPGDPALTAGARAQCGGMAANDLQESALSATMTVAAAVPDAAEWAHSHMIECLVADVGGASWTGSVVLTTGS
jgi:hypothetical protein